MEARKRLIRAEQLQPRRDGHQKALIKLQKYQNKIWKNKDWAKEEREELMKFLGLQATVFGMLVDDLGSTRVRTVKKEILMATWSKFIEGMGPPKEKPKPGKKQIGMRETNLRNEPCTSEPIVQGNVRTVTESIEAPIRSQETAR